MASCSHWASTPPQTSFLRYYLQISKNFPSWSWQPYDAIIATYKGQLVQYMKSVGRRQLPGPQISLNYGALSTRFFSSSLKSHKLHPVHPALCNCTKTFHSTVLSNWEDEGWDTVGFRLVSHTRRKMSSSIAVIANPGSALAQEFQPNVCFQSAEIILEISIKSSFVLLDKTIT